jgi:mannose/fructose/N-acetylgalactosamine-specific phosphotransferase system component IID
VKGRSTVSNLVQLSVQFSFINKIDDGWQVGGVYTDFSKAFDRVLHGLLKFNLSFLFGGSLLCWYLKGQAQRVKYEDFIFKSIRCHSGVLQGSHLGPIFFILNTNRALDLFENVNVLGYAYGLRLFMNLKCIGNCQLFQKDLDRLGE